MSGPIDKASTAIVRFIQNTVAAARSAVASRVGRMYDGLRDVYMILGYKVDLDYQDYLAMYMRQDVAGRIVDMPAQETWRNPPKLVPVAEETDESFFRSFEDIARRLDLFAWFEKVDRLSGIGRFGVLFIGVNDGGDLGKPVQFSVEKPIKPEDILYLAAYDEGRMTITQWDSDTQSVRFGLPVMYEITLAEFSDSNGVKSATATVRKKVHYTRVIHVAEDCLSDRVYGRPRLQRVFDRMWDMLKISGGSAEMFWQNVAQIFHINLDPELEYDEADLEELDAKMLEMLQGIRRIVQTEGINEIKPLQGKTPDPRGVFSMLKTLVASSAEIPQRILFGSEQGEMASTQDKSEWYGRIAARRQRHAEPVILMQFVMRLASWGALTLPDGGVKTEWPTLFEETPTEKAGRARSLAMAASKMNAGRPDMIIGRAEIREAAGLPRRIPEDVKKEIEEEDAKREAAKAEAEKKAKEIADGMASGPPGVPKALPGGTTKEAPAGAFNSELKE